MILSTDAIVVLLLFGIISFLFILTMTAEIDTDWEIEKYKTAHESDEHWELKRKFMETHKETLAEDELVCMAQVFANIEFLGCRYPNETMIRVAELAKGVVEQYRDKKKNNLKRTFVTASDAASSKVKGRKCLDHCTESKKQNLDVSCEGKFSKLVLFLSPDMSPQHILERSIQLNRLIEGTGFELEALPEGQHQAKYFISGEEIAKFVDSDRKMAQAGAANLALENLRQQCYCVILKDRFIGQSVEKSDFLEEPKEEEEKKLGDENVGCKLMKLMGWTGGALGSKAQGLVEPILPVTQVKRSGFGSHDLALFRQKITQYISDWIDSGATNDLSFSNEFDNVHRKIIHEVGQRFRIKTQSYGKKNNRRLVVSKKSSPWDLVTELQRGGDRCEKYVLLPPGSNFDFYNVNNDSGQL